MAKNNTDIGLLAGLSEDASYVEIVKNIQAIQKRLEASGIKIKLNIENEKVLNSINLKDIEKAFDNAGKKMSQALIKEFGIADKSVKEEIQSLVNDLKRIRLDEINIGNISEDFDNTLLKLNAVVVQNATTIKDNLSDALSESLTKEVSKMEATISAMNLKTSVEGIDKEATAMQEVEDSAKLAAVQKEKFADANVKVARTANTTTNAINEEVNAFMDMNNLDSILAGINYHGQQGNGIFNTLGESFRSAFSAYSMANLLERSLDKVVEAGKEAISVIKEFDDINVNLQMATGADKETVKELIDNYSALGGELGTLTKSVAESADTFLRQGRSMEETNQLIEDSIVLSKITGVESEKSAEILTATINGFQLAASEASRVNDILSSIDLHSASDASGIGDALTKVASMANNAGVSLEKTAAMIATIKDITQDADTTIGTSLKTVLSRMSSIRAAKFMDEESGEALNDVEKVLGKINVSMRDANGQFKEAEAIIDEVGTKWETLDSNTQKAVTTAMGGVYQANKLVALFDNYDKVLELTQVAEDSTGTAFSKFNDSYLPSLEAKTQALVSSLQALASTTISDELYASILDASKGIVDLTADTGILKATLIGLGAGGSLYAIQQLAGFLRGSAQELSNFSMAMELVDNGFTTTAADMQVLTDLTQGLSNSQMRLLLNTNNLTDAQKIALMVANGTEQELAEQQLQTWGLITAQQRATASTVTFTNVMRGLVATMAANPIFLVATGVTLAVSVFNAFSSAVEKAEQRLSELKTSLQDTTSELDSINSEIENVNRQIDELLAKDTPTLTDENDLKRLREENDELRARKILLEAQREEQAQEVNAEVEKRYKKEFQRESNVVISKETGQAEHYTDEEYLKVQIERANELLDLKRNLTEEEKKELDAIKSYITEQSNALIELADSYEPVTDEQKALKEGWEKLIAESSKVVGAYSGTVPDITVRLVEKFATEADTQNVDAEIEEWLQSLSDDDKKIMVTCDLEEASLEDLKQYLADQKGTIEKEAVVKVTFDQSAFNDTMKSYEEGYDKLISVQEEWNESKAISASTFADLQENGLLQYLQFTSEGLTINKEKLLENAQACKDKAVADLHAAMTSDMLAIAVGDTSNISETAQTVIADLGKNTEIAGNQALSSVANWATLGETISTVLSSAGVEGVSTDQQKQMSAVYDYYKKMAVDISNIDITYKSSGNGSGATDLAKKAKETLESTLNLYKTELDSGIIDLATYLKKCNDLLNDARDKAIITGKEYWDYQKEVTENQKDIYDKVLSAINRRYDKEIDSIEKVIGGIEKQNDALEKQKSIMDGVINAIIRILDREIDSIDDIVDGIEEQNEALEEQQDKYDSALSAISKYLEKQKELVQANIDGVEKENDAIQDEIDGYDKLLNAVTLVMDAKREAIEADKQGIQDRIDALRDENDEAKKAYELEQAKLDLKRLRSQRNKKLYVEGQGYIYDVDHKAIREQEDNVADLELDATISALEKEQELLDDILEQLDETEQKWQDIASVFENNKALDKAKELLGDNFQNIIIEGDESSINDILNSYINAQEKLEENALVIEDYEKRIEELEAIAEKWEASANIKEETENAINASELLGKQWQEDILADKQSTYENFCDNYLAIQSKIEDNTTLIESYNQKVEYYENLKEQWQGITDAYTIAQEDLSLVQMLGANAEADILSGRLDVLENFKNEYLSIQAQIEDNNLLITSYEEKVKYYENLKQQWADISDAYKNAEEDMYLTQVLGTNAEADLLNGRLDVLEDFKKKYAEIEQALVDIAWNSANEQNKALASVGSGSTNGSGNIGSGNGADVPDVPTDSTETNAPSNTRTVYEIIDANGESFGTYNSPEEAHSVAKRLVNSGEAERPYKIGEIDLPELIEKKKGSGGGSISKNTMAQVFHDGIKKGYPDTSMPKDKKVELLEKLATKEISLDSDEVPVIARKNEIFLNSPQQSMLAMNYERLLELTGNIPWNVPVVNSNPFANVNTAERGQTTNVSFGTINMYEVNNVRDFAAELDKYSPNIAVQYNGRHRR